MNAQEVLEDLVYHPSGGPRDEDALTQPHSRGDDVAESYLHAEDGSVWIIRAVRWHA